MPDHSHVGDDHWVSVWLFKTGYDYGPTVYFFREEKDFLLFKSHVEKLCKEYQIRSDRAKK